MPIVIHELVEWALCVHRGIEQSEVDGFDHLFELERKLGRHVDEEPGDSLDAPYRKEHVIAENIERLVVQALGLDWKQYEEHVNDVWFPPKVTP